MDNTAKQRTDGLTEAAISAAGFEDFREDYRDRLRWLKDNRPQHFADALAHYNDVLVPNIAAGKDPIAEWLEYGRLLGDLSGAGKAVSIDATGRAKKLTVETGHLDLHLPDDTATPALRLAVPRHLSDAQKATLDLLAAKRN